MFVLETKRYYEYALNVDSNAIKHHISDIKMDFLQDNSFHVVLNGKEGIHLMRKIALDHVKHLVECVDYCRGAITNRIVLQI